MELQVLDFVLRVKNTISITVFSILYDEANQEKDSKIPRNSRFYFCLGPLCFTNFWKRNKTKISKKILNREYFRKEN